MGGRSRQMGGLEMMAAGRRTQTSHSRLKHWRTLNSYALVYICEGKGSFESNASPESPVKAGDCFFLFPGVSHYYGPPAGSIWKEIWVLFRGELADQMLRERSISERSPVHSLSPTRRSAFQRSLESLAEEYGGRAGDFRIQCTTLLYNCLLLSTAETDTAPPLPDDSLLLEEMKQILHSHLGSSRKIPSYFKTRQYSYNTLRMTFQRLEGESPGQYLNNLRMQRAEEQLLWSGLGITEIARSLGFTDSRYFSRVFRKHTGNSPGEYRKRYHLIRKSQ